VATSVALAQPITIMPAPNQMNPDNQEVDTDEYSNTRTHEKSWH
jgi:hypothetical protein